MVGDLARSIATADIDGDGDQDLLIANDLSNNVAVLENNQGNFSLLQNIPLGNRPQSIATYQTPAMSVPVIAVAAIGTSKKWRVWST